MAVVRAENQLLKMNKFVYKIVKVIADDRSDERVLSEAETVINEHASSGWRLHTYSYVSADAGGFMQGVLGQYTATNLLHLVFEKEIPLSKEEKILVEEEKTLAQKKAEAAIYLAEMRNKREQEQGSAESI